MKKIISLLLVLCIFSLNTMAAISTKEEIAETKKRITETKNNTDISQKTNEIFVNAVKPNECKYILQQALYDFEYEVIKKFNLTDSYLVSFNSVEEADRAVDRLNERDDIKYAEPNYRISLAAPVPVKESGFAKQESFVTLKIPFPDNIRDNDKWRTLARFKDSGQGITLSMFYNEYVYATVPYESKDRELEAFVPDAIKFTDNEDSKYEFHVIESLSRTGVIIGNEKGEAKPFDNVTRAEATAMITRFLGLHGINDYELSFEDVKRNDWYWGYVASAHKAGIITGDSDKAFSPARNITREEATAMITRALTFAGLKCAPRNIENFADKDKVSDWAKEAYELIGSAYASDYDDSDPENPVRILAPQKAASRYDIAYMLDNAAKQGQLYASDLACQYGFDKEMPVIDGSTSTYPFTQAVYTTLFANGSTHKNFPVSHSKSHASYERLINGEVDMLFASSHPTEDLVNLAAEKNVELEFIPIAYDAMIFFTNAENPATGLTKQQISDIYVNDAYETWEDLSGNNALLYPYCRNNDSGSHAQMEKHFLKGNEINEKIRKETTSVTMSNVLTDVMGSKTDNPEGYGLGYSIFYYFKNMDLFYNTSTELKLLSVDGVLPTDETIANGSYPLSNNAFIVLKKDTPKDSPARRMVEFMLSPAGQECVAMAGYGKLIN